MESQLSVIECKRSDYKICKGCGSINWYENEYCHNCAHPTFDKRDKAVHNWVKEERKFWEEADYDETEIDDLKIEI